MMPDAKALLSLCPQGFDADAATTSSSMETKAEELRLRKMIDDGCRNLGKSIVCRPGTMHGLASKNELLFAQGGVAGKSAVFGHAPRTVHFLPHFQKRLAAAIACVAFLLFVEILTVLSISCFP